MVILDIETSGLDPQQHGLLSVGAIDFLRPQDSFYGECRLRQNEQFEQAALDINGFSAESIKDSSKLSAKELIRQFDNWLKKRSVKVVGGMHIASFDVPFLLTKAKQTRVSLNLHKRSIDLHSIAYGRMLQLKKIIPLTDGWSVMDTDTIYPFCGLPKEPIPHSALAGAKLEAESLSRLIHGRNLLPEFRRYEIPGYLKKATPILR